MGQAHGAIEVTRTQNAAAVFALDDQLDRAGAGADQLKPLRLDQRRGSRDPHGQCQPCQHAPAQQAGGYAAKRLQGHGSVGADMRSHHTASAASDHA